MVILNLLAASYFKKEFDLLTNFKKMKKQKDLKVLAIGFALIILVIIITILRGSLFSTKKENAANSSENQTSVIPGEKYQTISTTQLQKELSTGKKLTLLDIRAFENYANEHILDSVNIPLTDFPVGSKINALNPVVIITTDLGEEDKASVEAVIKSLSDEHLTNVRVLAGGIDAWKKNIGALVNFGDPKSFTDQSKVSYVEADKLNEALKQGVATFILDVRTPAEYASGHLKGSLNVPFDDLEKRRSEIQPFPKVIVVGINELQEFQASVQLYDMILIQPFVLKGGINTWQKKGFELVK
jgi:rhodanese-related sulfurtransferase